MSYDRADWHHGGDFPEALPEEAGGTHIGMFLAWAIVQDQIAAAFFDQADESIERVRSRQMTGRDFLFQECDGKFWEEMLSEEGNAFAKQYYKRKYFEDYERVLGAGHQTLYHVEDSWENFDRIAHQITQAWTKWRSRGERRWWQFWR